MRDWNAVITSPRWPEDRLLRELTGVGEFRFSGFTAVILGRVPEVGRFLADVRRFRNDF